MKIKTVLILLGSFLVLQSCVSRAVKVKMDAVADSDQMIYQGSELTSVKRHAVSISPYKNIEHIKSNTLFEIAVENRSEKPLFINNDNISVIFKGSDIEWKSKKINVQPLQEFMRDLSDDYFYEEARILSHVITLANLRSVKGQDVVRAALKVKKLRLALSRFLNVMPERYLKPQLIKPHKSITGVVACDTSKLPETLKGHFQVIISIDGEDHEFTFLRSFI